MNISVNNAQVSFVEGKLALGYFNVSFNAGQFPNSLNGSLQIIPSDGVSIQSTPDEVIAVAKIKIQDLVADQPQSTTTTTTTTVNGGQA